MKVAVGSDDNYEVAKSILDELKARGFEVVVIGALKTGKPYPWPKVGFEVGEMVAKKKVDFGIVICYTGTGASIAANKVKGVRAALCTDAQTAKGARMWNDANVLAISARLTTKELAKEIIEAWLAAEVDKSELNNISMIEEYEIKN